MILLQFGIYDFSFKTNFTTSNEQWKLLLSVGCACKAPLHSFFNVLKWNFIYVSLRLRVQNVGPAEPCVGKY